jgi:hypothetical protein
MSKPKSDLDPTAHVEGKASANPALQTTIEGATELSEANLNTVAGGTKACAAGVHIKEATITVR